VKTKIIRPHQLPTKLEAERLLLPIATRILDELRERFPEDVRLEAAHFEVNQRLLTTLGRAQYASGLVDFSRVLAMPENSGIIEDTVRHELAHIAVGKGHGHGPVWKRKAAQYGADTTAACRVPVAARRPRERHVHLCLGCQGEVLLTRQMSAKHIGRVKRYGYRYAYRHSVCGGEIAETYTRRLI
jgi:predicted SprT family Zn-dependent metalloprotease